uniref:Variant surface glycoprotein n=1 Tax=Trypanosoma brucei TaxID=5691 RepID=A0A1V0FXW3_9TRYP|nr:variant surface glycoprotein [Trypanosoma brucei]
MTFRKTEATSIAIILFTAVFRTGTPSGFAISNTGWKKLCEMSETLVKLPGMAKGKLGLFTEAKKTYMETALMLQIATNMNPVSNNTVLYDALATLAAQKAATLADQTVGVINKAVQAATLATEQTGRIAEYIEMLAKASGSTGSTGFCLANSGGSSNDDTAALASKCIIKDRTYIAHTTDLDTSEFDGSGFKKFSTETNAKDSTATDKCVLYQNSGTQRAGMLYQHTTPVDHLQGLLKITASAGATAAIPQLSNIAANGVVTGSKTLGELYTTIASLNNIKAAAYTKTPSSIINELSADAKAVQEIRNQLALKTPELEASALDKAATELKDKLGQKNDAGETTVWAALKDLQVKGSEENSATDTKLVNLRDLGKLTKVLTYYYTQRRSELEKAKEALKQKEAQINTEKSKTATQICNEKTDADTCRKDKNCKYDDKKKEGPKCVLSEEGEKAAAKEAANQEGKDDKTNTSTTGSNSFVIKKTPLLLAVLFLA